MDALIALAVLTMIQFSICCGIYISRQMIQAIRKIAREVLEDLDVEEVKKALRSNL